MNFTDSERLALSLADDRTKQVCMVYFEMKRCKDCNPHGRVEFRSCWNHNAEMVAIPKAKK